MMPPTQRLKILGSGGPAPLRTSMVKRPHMIEIAPPGRHPTTGKRTVLIPSDHMPRSLCGRLVGKGIGLHEQPTRRLNKKPPPYGPAGEGNLPNLAGGDGPVPLEFPRPIINAHKHIERHGDVDNGGGPATATALKHCSPRLDDQVVQRIGPLLIECAPVVPVPNGVRLHDLLHHGGALGGQHGPEQCHPVLLRIGQQLPLPHTLLMPGFGPLGINPMNLPPHSGPSLPRGLLRHPLDERPLDLPSRVHRQHGTLLGHDSGLLIRDLPIGEQPQGCRMPPGQKPSSLQPLGGSGIGQLQGTGDFFNGTVPLTEKNGIHIRTHTGHIGLRRPLGVIGNQGQQLNLLGLQPPQMPLHNGKRINPPPRRKPLTFQIIKSGSGLSRGRLLPQQGGPGIQRLRGHASGDGRSIPNRFAQSQRTHPLPPRRALRPHQLTLPSRRVDSLHCPSLSVIWPGQVRNRKGERKDPKQGTPEAPRTYRTPRYPKAAKPPRRAGETQSRPKPPAHDQTHPRAPLPGNPTLPSRPLASTP